eukprot:gb/GECG01003551.1/.p1 GENE.gb/GECG01003551.1/~~gb/GECG01003551.1/.p1  ORF type:complete len:369 (+),score=31.88 gb/GECG01003551.1/:1-1107(+)
MRRTSSDEQYRTHYLGEHVFHVRRRYVNLQVTDTTTNSVVVRGADLARGKPVIIHKCFNLQSRGQAKRLLVEIRVLRHFGNHGNIIHLIDLMMYPPDSSTCEALYLVTESFDCSLRALLRSNQVFQAKHIQYFLYQILRSLKYLHSAGIAHTNLSSAEAMVNNRCDLSLVGFGNAHDGPLIPERIFGDESIPLRHRAPEVLCENYNYPFATDIWATGCILAEFILRSSATFVGDTSSECLSSICTVIGSPSQQELEDVMGTKDEELREQLRSTPASGIRATLETALGPTGADLLWSLLKFDPRKRMTAEEALQHEYFRRIRRQSTEPICNVPFRVCWDSLDSSPSSYIFDRIREETAAIESANAEKEF